MLRPTVGELLKVISESLRQSVLPALGPGAAQRQLKAALHTLGRIEKSWDLLPGYLSDDNADMSQCVGEVLRSLNEARITLPSRISSLSDAVAALPIDEHTSIQGVNDGSLAARGAMNVRLQAMLTDLDTWLRAPSQLAVSACVEQAQVLDGLYSRMVNREIRAWAAEGQDS